MYIELKSCEGGHDDHGPARIGRVTFSKSGRTIYYGSMQLQRARLFCGNYQNVETGDEYWISGPKKDGRDRYPWAQRSPVEIDEDVREEYWTTIRNEPNRRNERFT